MSVAAPPNEANPLLTGQPLSPSNGADAGSGSGGGGGAGSGSGATTVSNADNPLLKAGCSSQSQSPQSSRGRGGAGSPRSYGDGAAIPDAASLPNSENPLLTGIPSCNQNPLTAPRYNSHGSPRSSRDPGARPSGSGANRMSPRASKTGPATTPEPEDKTPSHSNGKSSTPMSACIEAPEADPRAGGKILNRSPDLQMKQRCRITCMVALGAARTAIAGGGDTVIFIVDGTGGLVDTIKGPTDTVSCMLHHRSQLWVGSDDKKLYVYDDTTFAQLAKISAERVPQSLAPAPQGVFVQRNHHKLICYSPSDFKSMGYIVSAEIPNALMYSCKHMWTLYTKGFAQWIPETFANVETQSWPGGIAGCSALVVTADRFFVGTRYGMLYMLSRALVVLDSLRVPTATPITSLYFTGKRLSLVLAGTKDGNVVIYHKQRSGLSKQEMLFGHEKAVTSIVPRHDQLWTGSHDKLVLTWTLEDYKSAPETGNLPRFQLPDQPEGVSGCCTIL